jgi:WD40 repeat protein
MTTEEALEIVEQVLSEEGLSKLQLSVFRCAWEEQSYQEIATKLGYEVGYLKQTGSQLWQALSRALGEKVTKNNLQLVLKRKVRGQEGQGSITSPLSPPSPQPPAPSPQPDWGDAIDVSVFSGRTDELATLQRWVLSPGCRLVGVFGMGGMGKTSVAVKLAKQIQGEFEYVIWRSLRNAPPLADLLADLLQFLCHQGQTGLPNTVDGRMLQLLDKLRSSRCLLILDNCETVMRLLRRRPLGVSQLSQDSNSDYETGYEGYGQLFRCVGETEHQSVLMITSREKPICFTTNEGENLPIRSLHLTGLPPSAGVEIFNIKGDFAGSADEWEILIKHYAGNPLALKMVASVIKDFFDGKLSNFLEVLQEGTLVFGGIRDVLARQINRLSDLEKQVMYWLAVYRKPVSFSELRADFVPQVSVADLLEALTSLQQRSLIEKHRSLFTLLPVVMEYMTDCLIEQVCAEIFPLPPALLRTHALIKATAADYIRETQTRLILKPIAEKLLAASTKVQLEAQFKRILAEVRGKSPQETGYIAGNILNLLSQLQIDPSGWDFSYLTVWQAYLNQVNLRFCNFQGANLAKSVFSETFSQILSVAFSPDSKLLATGDVNHEIHVWQVADGKKLLTFKVNEGWIWSVAFSPNGRLLASSANRSVHLWDIHSGQCIKVFHEYTDRVFSLAFSPDGQLLASGSEDHLVRVWDVRKGEILRVFSGHTDEVRSVAFAPQRYANSPDGHLLASGSYDCTVRLWDVNSGECVQVLPADGQKVATIAFSPDGSTLASGGSQGLVQLWDIDAKLLSDIVGWVERSETQQATLGSAVAQTPVASTGGFGAPTSWGWGETPARRWLPNLQSLNATSYQAGTHRKTLSGHAQQIRTLAFSLDGQTLASGSDDKSIRLWNWHTGECQRILRGHKSWISAVAYSPDGSLLASASEDQSVRLWDSRSNHCLKTLQGHSNGVWSVAFHPHNTQIASGSQDGFVRLWSSSDGEYQGSFPAHSHWVWSVAYSPNGTLIATGSEDQSIKLWHPTGQLLQTLLGHRDTVFSVIFNQQGDTLFSGSLDGTIKLWDVTTGVCRQTLTEHVGGVWCISLSQDGEILVSASQDQTVKLWHTRTGECFQTLSGHSSWVRCCAIAPDGQIIASGSSDGMVKLWYAHRGECYQTFVAHNGPVLSLAFAPDGKTFASSGADAVIKIWDAAQGKCLQILPGHEKWVRFITWSSHGQLASCSQDETIKLWQIGEWEFSHPQSQTLRIPRPYEGMTITDVTGLTEAQKSTLKTLGAIAALPTYPLEFHHSASQVSVEKLDLQPLLMKENSLVSP